MAASPSEQVKAATRSSSSILTTLLGLVQWVPADVYVTRKDFTGAMFLAHDDYVLLADRRQN
jgi:hypothetical protein